MAENRNSIHNIVCDPKEPVGSYAALPAELKDFIRRQKAECSFLANNRVCEFIPAYRANFMAQGNRTRRNEDPDSLAIRPCGEI